MPEINVWHNILASEAQAYAKQNHRQEVIMNKTTAIIVTVVSALLCGCPGLALAGLGVMAALGSQMPEVMAQNANSPQQVLLGAGMFICFGAILIVIPIIVGVLSIRYATPTEPSINEFVPPAS